MSKDFDYLRPLSDVIHTWGGKLIVGDRRPVDLKKDDDFNKAPFAWRTLGVCYRRKIIYANGAFPVGGIIHEAGHVFASKTPPYELTDETFFLGWEFLLARKVDLVDEWLDSMRGYSLGGRDFGYMDIDEQTDLIEDYVERSRRRGLIDGEEPLSVR